MKISKNSSGAIEVPADLRGACRVAPDAAVFLRNAGRQEKKAFRFRSVTADVRGFLPFGDIPDLSPPAGAENLFLDPRERAVARQQRDRQGRMLLQEFVDDAVVRREVEVASGDPVHRQRDVESAVGARVELAGEFRRPGVVGEFFQRDGFHVQPRMLRERRSDLADEQRDPMPPPEEFGHKPHGVELKPAECEVLKQCRRDLHGCLRPLQ